MSFITFNRSPPNLCCKHVPTDSLKELIALNNLTIWLFRSIPTRSPALQRLGPIQMTLWLREREVVKACQEAERRREWQRPPSGPCLSCWRPRTPARPWISTIQTGDRRLECYWERMASRRKAVSEKEGKQKEKYQSLPEREDPTSHIAIYIFPPFLPLSLETQIPNANDHSRKTRKSSLYTAIVRLLCSYLREHDDVFCLSLI